MLKINWLTRRWKEWRIRRAEKYVQRLDSLSSPWSWPLIDGSYLMRELNELDRKITGREPHERHIEMARKKFNLPESWEPKGKK